jgi:hypothetical protein
MNVPFPKNPPVAHHVLVIAFNGRMAIVSKFSSETHAG